MVLTDATLTKAQASKVASVAHDGLARAVRPVHSMRDGDTIFCLASGMRLPIDDPRQAVADFDALLAMAADVFAVACADGMRSASGRGLWSSYAELAPSTLPPDDRPL